MEQNGEGWVEMVEEGPTRRQRYLFWVILCCLSAFFAEVISSSYPYTFVSPWGLIAVIPLYGLHTLILAFVVFKVGRPRFSSLYIAGCIFGMYEAYVTKVLWNPPWETVAEPTTRVAGVAVVELGVISFCWHPFMAFIVPLAVAMVLTTSPGMMEAMPKRLDGWLRHKEWTFLVLLAIWAGLVMGSQVDPLTAGLANTISLVVLFILGFHFLRETGGRYSMEQLLPDGREVRWLLGALMVYFAISGPLFDPERLPGFGPQALIVLIYAVLLLLLKRTIDVGRAEGPRSPWRPSLTRDAIMRLFGLYTAIAIVTSILAALFLGPLFLVLSWFAWAVIAIISMGHSIKDAIVGGRSQGSDGATTDQP